MALTPYCEPAEVRAALGVNSKELADAVLSLPIYEIGLLRELNKISLSLPAAFLAVEGIACANRTDQQKSLHAATRMFCVYASARQVGVSLGTFMPKDIGDGKATIGRFTDGPYKDTMTRIEAVYLDARANLADVYATSSNTTSTPLTAPSMFVGVPRLTDVITGA